MGDPRYRLTIDGYHFRKSEISGYKIIEGFILRIYLSGQVIDILRLNKKAFEEMLSTFEGILDF